MTAARVAPSRSEAAGPHIGPAASTRSATSELPEGCNNPHENICEDIELFAQAVMAGFKEQKEARQRQKDDELAPFMGAALNRKERMKELAEDEIPSYPAYGFSIAETATSNRPEAQQRRMEVMRRMREIAERQDLVLR